MFAAAHNSLPPEKAELRLRRPGAMLAAAL